MPLSSRNISRIEGEYWIMRTASTVEGVQRQLRACEACKTKPMLLLGNDGIPICEDHWSLYCETLCFDGERFWLEHFRGITLPGKKSLEVTSIFWS